MKVGIVSDTHGCVETWRLIYEEYLKDSELIIHAGDLLYHGPRNVIPKEYNPKELAEEFNKCNVPIVAVSGNCDSEVDGMVIDFPIEAPYAHLIINKLKIIVNHGHLFDEETRLQAAKRMKAGLFITGHSHIPELFEDGDAVFLNPGSPAMSKRSDKKGTIAIIEEKNIRVIDILNGEILLRHELRHPL